LLTLMFRSQRSLNHGLKQVRKRRARGAQRD
jgi:hypothetical protein